MSPRSGAASVASTAATQFDPPGPLSFSHPAKTWLAVVSNTWQRQSARRPLR